MAINQLGDGSADGVQLPNTKLGVFGAAPAAQQTPAGNSHTVASGAAGTSVCTTTTFDGSIGSTAYTVGDLVAILKTLGLLKA